MSKSIILAVVAAAAAVGVSAADAGTPLVNGRQSVQAHRIYGGIANGSLTFRETAQLVRGQARVNRIEARAKADGIVGPWERARLHVAQGVQSGRIWRRKHN